MLQSTYTDVNEIYIGSTKDYAVRKSKHKSSCNNENSPQYNYKLYKYIREHGGFDYWNMIILDEIETEDIKKVRKLEAENIYKYKASLNTRLHPGRTDKECFKDYREKNREIIKQKFSCDCGGKYTKVNYSRHIKTNKHINHKEQDLVAEQVD